MPLHAQRVDYSLDKIPQWPGNGKAVGDSERVEHTDVFGVKRSSAVIQVGVRTSFWDFGDPGDTCGRDAGIVRMRAQRARAWCKQAVKSDEYERSLPCNPISTDKCSFHESHVSMKPVTSCSTCSQVRTRSCQKEISLTNQTFKIKDF